MSKASLFLRTNPSFNGVDEIRLKTPHEKLKREGFIDCDYHPTWEMLARRDYKNDKYNIILLTRQISSHSFIHQAMDILKRVHGLKVVLDLDDDYELPTWHPKYKLYKKQENDKDLIAGVMAADWVITTQPLLADKVKKLNKNVVILPNAIDMDSPEWNDNSGKSESDRVRFGYTGSNTHKLDVMLLKESFKKVHQESLNAHLFLCGVENGTDHSNEMIKVFESDKPQIPVTTVPMVPVWSYPNIYNLFDVALAPLRDNEFNSMKSNLKVLEAGAKKMPIIVSGVDPYIADIAKHNIWTVDPVSNNWYDGIKYYTVNQLKIKEDGLALHDYVKTNYNLDKINKTRLEFYQSII